MFKVHSNAAENTQNTGDSNRPKQDADQVSIPGNGTHAGERSSVQNSRPVAAPDPQVLEQPARRQFTLDYKWRVVQALEKCSHGEKGALLRREGLYSSTVKRWQRQFEQAGQLSRALAASGRTAGQLEEEASRVVALEDEIKRLRKQLQKTTHKLEQANTIIEVQKKIYEMFVTPLNSPKSDSSES